MAFDNDTLYVPPRGTQWGRAVAARIRDARIVNCEIVIEQAAPVDPLKGISATTGNDGGSRSGTELNDNLRGGAGSDKITGLGGDDVLWGDQNHDALPGARKAGDLLDGGAGNDTLVGGKGRDLLYGRTGDDVLSVRDGVSDRVSCGSGRDRVVADRLDVVSRDCERVVRR
jgi:hypothetical protein